MLRKLLKYDLKSVFGIVWIPVVALLAFSPLVGLCYRISEANSNIFSGLLFGSSVLIYVFSLSAIILILWFFSYRRFYCNLFSDEGYLTFTLPVKRSLIVLSKSICTAVFMFAGILTLLLSLLLAFAPAGGLPTFFRAVGSIFSGLYELAGGFTVLYTFEALLLLFGYLLFGQFLIQLAITIGATVAKKHKILAAIGFYYAINTGVSVLLTLILELPLMEIVEGMMHYMALASATKLCWVLGIMLFVGVLLFAIIDLMFYLIALHIIERKLNLE